MSHASSGTRYFAVQLLIVIFMLPLTLLRTAHAASPAGNQPAQQNESFADSAYEIGPGANVDEELFLLNTLLEIYNDWPSADDPEVVNWIAGNRPVLYGLRKRISDRRLSGNLALMYDNCSNLLDAYDRYLVNLGIIDKQTANNVLYGTGEVIVGGAAVAGQEKLRGASDEQAQKAGMRDAFGSAMKKGIQIYGERREAISAENAKLNAQIEATQNSLKLVSQRLTRERGWQPGESGFDVNISPRLVDQVERRPRDPFPLCKLATSDLANEKSAAGAMRRSNWCLQAAQLVPGGRAYDAYRARFLGWAVELALTATGIEDSFSYSAGPSASGLHALRLSRSYLSLDPNDADNFGHLELARALSFQGRYSEAVDAANVAVKSYGRNTAFAFRYAKLMSLIGSLDEVDKWLSYAYSLGWNDVDAVRSPDFANFRRNRPQRYAELTTVRLPRPEFVWGLVLDDIVLRNDSAFDLTNVHMKLWVRKGQSQTWNFDLKCKSIRTGSSCKVDNVGSITGDSYDEMRVTFFECDQLPAN